MSSAPALLSRLEGLLFGRPREVSLQSLASPVVAGGLELGLTKYARKIVTLGDVQLLKNLLVLGPPELGARTFLEHLVCQQVGRGGGVLVLDPVPSTRLPVLMHLAANAANRTDFEWLPAEPHPTKVAKSFIQDRATYVSLDFLSAPRESRVVSRYLQLEFQQAMVERAGRGYRSAPQIPYMVVLPQVSVHASPRWTALAGQARSLGVFLVMQENSLMETQLAGEYFFSNILKHTGTKVLLPPDSPDSRGMAAERLAHFVGRDTADFQKDLKRLSRGNALVLRKGHLFPLKLRHLLPCADTSSELANPGKQGAHSRRPPPPAGAAGSVQ